MSTSDTRFHSAAALALISHPWGHAAQITFMPPGPQEVRDCRLPLSALQWSGSFGDVDRRKMSPLVRHAVNCPRGPHLSWDSESLICQKIIHPQRCLSFHHASFAILVLSTLLLRMCNAVIGKYVPNSNQGVLLFCRSCHLRQQTFM